MNEQQQQLALRLLDNIKHDKEDLIWLFNKDLFEESHVLDALGIIAALPEGDLAAFRMVVAPTEGNQDLDDITATNVTMDVIGDPYFMIGNEALISLLDDAMYKWMDSYTCTQEFKDFEQNYFGNNSDYNASLN